MNRNRHLRPSGPSVCTAQRGAAKLWRPAFIVVAAVVFGLALIPQPSDLPAVYGAPKATAPAAAQPANEAPRLDYRIEQPTSSDSDEVSTDQGNVHG